VFGGCQEIRPPGGARDSCPTGPYAPTFLESAEDACPGHPRLFPLNDPVVFSGSRGFVVAVFLLRRQGDRNSDSALSRKAKPAEVFGFPFRRWTYQHIGPLGIVYFYSVKFESAD
jgi:hypothetical protein